MLIQEIPSGSKVIVSFSVKGSKLAFETETIEIEGHIRFKPIYTNGLAINLRNSICKDIKLIYINKKSGRTHTWTDCIADYYKDKYYVIQSKNESKQINRRDAIRIPIGIKTVCNISDIDEAVECEIEDLSIVGIGIVIDTIANDLNLIHREFTVKLIDDKYKSEFDITALCIHVDKVSDTKCKCGCMILKTSSSINRYINVRQTKNFQRFINHTSKNY